MFDSMDNGALIVFSLDRLECIHENISAVAGEESFKLEMQLLTEVIQALEEIEQRKSFLKIQNQKN